MRVWHVYASDRLGPVNGVVQAIHRMAEAQRAQGLAVDVLHGTTDDPLAAPATGTAAGLRRHVHVNTSNGNRPDIVHLHELFRPPHLALAPLLRHVPYLVSTHGATAPDNLARYRWRKAVYGRTIERALVRRAAAVVALTPTERDEVRRWLPGGPPITVVPNVADPGLLGATAWAPPDDRAAPLVCLARWDVRHKGLDRLAAVAARLPETPVVVHGGPCGNEPRLLESFRATAPPNLQLAPAVSGADKAQALRGAAGFVLLSRWEGLSMALLEALALGVPCIVSPEVAATLGDRGPVTVLPADPDHATGVLRRLLHDPSAEQRRSIGAAGRRWAAEHASPVAVGRATAQLYRDVVARTAIAATASSPAPG